MAAIIGYANHLSDISAMTLTATSEATGFVKENLYSWSTWDWWKPTSNAAQYLIVDLGASYATDYLAIHGHDLFSQAASVTFEYSDTGTSGPWTTLVAAFSPVDNTTIFKTFTSVTKRYYRVSITGLSAACYIAALSFGARLDLPYGMVPGFTPPPYSYNDALLNQQSIAGNFLGRSLKRQGVKFTIEMPSVLTPSWIRTYWDPFITKAKLRPFFFSWDNTNYPEEAAYAWSFGAIKPPVHDTASFLKVSLECEGLL